MTNYYAIRREILIAEKGGKCVNCGSKKDLDFDHIDPKQKSFTVASKWSYALSTLRNELKKCQLLCKSCHKEKHKPKHGTYSMYRHYHCRCRSCMDSFNLARKKWRKTAKENGKIW